MNAARGPVVVTDDLLKALDEGVVSRTVIDTWDQEPACRQDLLDRADLASPHIAGHSFEGKAMGTAIVYREACRFLGVEPSWSIEGLWPPPLVPEITMDATGRRDEEVLWDLVRRVYDIEADDRRFRESRLGGGSGTLESEQVRSARFDRLRKEYPVRREFRFTRVDARHASAGLLHKIASLGFRLD